MGVAAAAFGFSSSRAERVQRAQRVNRALHEASSVPRTPIVLPSLTAAELQQLQTGLPVRRQERQGRQGSGFVVVDVDAPPSLVFNCLKSFEEYAEMIPVIRKAEVKARGCTPDNITTAYADYKVSKFWLNFSVVHRVDEAAGLVQFGLDPLYVGSVLKEASGFWHVEKDAPANNPNRCRVWLHVVLRASSLLPDWIIDYAAERALRRATSWLQPHVELLWKRKALRHVQSVCEALVAPPSSNRPLLTTC